MRISSGLVGLALAAGLAPGLAQAELIYGLTGDNRIVTFDGFPDRAWLERLWLAYALVMRVTPERVFLSFLILFFGHQLVTVIGYALGMRRTIR